MPPLYGLGQAIGKATVDGRVRPDGAMTKQARKGLVGAAVNSL